MICVSDGDRASTSEIHIYLLACVCVCVSIEKYGKPVSIEISIDEER